MFLNCLFHREFVYSCPPILAIALALCSICEASQVFAADVQQFMPAGKDSVDTENTDHGGQGAESVLPKTYRWQHDRQVVGKMLSVQATQEDNFISLARQYGFGYEELLLANPRAEHWTPELGSQVNLPGRRILPKSAPLNLAAQQLLDAKDLDDESAGHTAIVINLPEQRLFLFKGSSVSSYPLGIGRPGWNTPLLNTQVTAMVIDPAWKPPASIREEAEQQGNPLPVLMLPGPENPLGTRAIKLGNTRYFVHGTNRPSGIGKRVSHGCLRMLPGHIGAMFDEVSVGTRVEVVNQPVKAGWLGANLFVEVHPALVEDGHDDQSLLSLAREVVLGAMLDRQAAEGINVTLLDDRLLRAVQKSDGVPYLVAHPE